MENEADVVAQLRAAERARCDVLMRSDVTALGRMLRADLAHVHLNGTVDGRSDYLAGLRDRFRFLSVRRGTLNIRAYGNTAVMIGELIQRTRNLATQSEQDIRAVTTQVWVRETEGWKLSTCHNAVPV
ncbi:nuclear transport factor 2 family protein [Alphaproteobacteria bacterium KMM 3653]|uniref:Nuclear transport factor 2 family protein n=1 Tax=Harenicola maris TaxID=2841044 RepID=A0AAP2CRU1_9RHOB|nr:nuclear transport factor 2 family protein [Harenicola maris]